MSPEQTLSYEWNPRYTQARVVWRQRHIADLCVPSFGVVYGRPRVAYVFTYTGQVFRFGSEESARSALMKRVLDAENKLASVSVLPSKENAA